MFITKQRNYIKKRKRKRKKSLYHGCQTKRFGNEGERDEEKASGK